MLKPVRTVHVSLGNRSYDIKIAPGLLDRLGRECARLKLGRRCAIITDTNVGRRYAKTVFNSLATAGFSPSLIIVQPGEAAKSLKTVQSCYDQLAVHRLERKSFIVTLGGGVVGDLAGFLAATYLRGIAFVQAMSTIFPCAISVRSRKRPRAAAASWRSYLRPSPRFRSLSVASGS